MNLGSPTCKDNNAAYVKRIMPGMLCESLRRPPHICPQETISTGQRSQKELDTASDKSIIVFTDRDEGFRDSHGRQRCQARGAPTTGDSEPACCGMRVRRYRVSNRTSLTVRSCLGRIADWIPKGFRAAWR
jgi:hypothetical protein